jgi:putative addiction module component (TIGR02574 family)
MAATSVGRRTTNMSTLTDEVAAKISDLSDSEKLQVVDLILSQLDRPDPEIDKVWANEARARWEAYKAGRLQTVSYDEAMARYRK